MRLPTRAALLCVAAVGCDLYDADYAGTAYQCEPEARCPDGFRCLRRVCEPPDLYRDVVLDDEPVAYWRLGELNGARALDVGDAVDGWYEGGIAQLPATVGLHKLAGLFAYVQSVPDLKHHAEGVPGVEDALEWLADTRVAVRLYGATAAPSKGEFFSMGGSELFRGFDLAQRQGSTVWVGSVEWRVPLARRVKVDVLDHVASLRNVHAALFYDVGDAYTRHHSVGPVAHGVGVGLRLDVSWFSFVERTTLRLDVAKAVNLDTGVQVWVGLNHPF